MRLLIATLLTLLTALPVAAQGLSAEELNKGGIDYSADRDYEKAGQAFAESVLLYDRHSSMAWYRRGMLDLEAGRHEAALSCFVEAAHRDPANVEAVERAGYLFYLRGADTDAVSMGEKVLALDPDNAQVKQWLPEAYKRRVIAMKNPQEPGSVQAEIPIRTRPLFDAISIFDSQLIVEVSGSIRSGIDNTTDADYRYLESQGNITNFPYSLNVFYRMHKHWGLNAVMENPWTGGGMPRVCTQHEGLEALYFGPRFIIGGGLRVSHHKTGEIFGEDTDIYDIKGGFVFRRRSRDTELELTVYPKFLIPDGSYSKGKTMDTSVFAMKYAYVYRPDFRFYSRIDSADYFFYDNRENRSVYFGSLLVAAGAHLDLFRVLNRGDLRISGEIGKKINFEKSADKNIYGFANGQGCPGLDLDGGDLFSGYHSSSTMFSVTLGERYNERFFFSQQFSAEIAGYKAYRSEYVITISGGYAL